jgi:Protein of unknown function (DUF2865).
VSQKHKKTVVFGRILIATAAIVSALSFPMASASAGSIFDFLFGGGRRSAPTPNPVAPLLNAFANPSGDGVVDGNRRESGPSVAYCVRLCDGHPFPVQSSNASTAQACASMCPAAKTKVFAGGSIDGAVASDGKRYAELPTAFVYRKQLVANCTCNGKTTGGLVRIDTKSDPTLRPGDIIATNEGLMSYRGSNGKAADFTPVQDRKLTEIRVRHAPTSDSALAARAEEPPPRDVDEPTSTKSKRRAQR